MVFRAACKTGQRKWELRGAWYDCQWHKFKTLKRPTVYLIYATFPRSKCEDHCKQTISHQHFISPKQLWMMDDVYERAHSSIVWNGYVIELRDCSEYERSSQQRRTVVGMGLKERRPVNVYSYRKLVAKYVPESSLTVPSMLFFLRSFNNVMQMKYQYDETK